MNKALLDTDILSEIGKAKNPTVAGNAKTYRRSFGHFTLSTVSVMEVVSGFQRTQAAARLNAFLATLPHMEILSFDEQAGLIWARLMAGGRAAGRPRSALDMIVAAVAEANGCLVATDNERDFAGLPIVNPMRPRP